MSTQYTELQLDALSSLGRVMAGNLAEQKGLLALLTASCLTLETKETASWSLLGHEDSMAEAAITVCARSTVGSTLWSWLACH